MPSKSKAQRNLMAAAAHNPAFAKKVGVPVSVAQEFNKADKGKKFGSGGMAKKLFGGKETYGEELKEAKALKSGKISSKQFVKGEKSEGHKGEENPSLLAKEIKSGSMSPKQYASAEAKEMKMKKGGMCKGYAKGGVAKTVTKEMEYDYKTGKKSFAGSTAKKDAHAEKEGKIVAKHLAFDKDMDKMKCGGKVKKYARGGGIEVRGKTRGKFV